MFAKGPRHGEFRRDYLCSLLVNEAPQTIVCMNCRQPFRKGLCVHVTRLNDENPTLVNVAPFVTQLHTSQSLREPACKLELRGNDEPSRLVDIARLSTLPR